MADTTALKNRIRAAIKANDNQEITGPVLQQSLLDIVDELNGATETEASQRQNSDTALQQNINTEAQQRQLGDSTLQQGINNEAQLRQNGDNALQQLINTISSKLGNNAVFAGIATPNTTPGTFSGPTFYIGGPGEYSNFGNTISVISGELCVFKYTENSWHKEIVRIIDSVDIYRQLNSIKISLGLSAIITKLVSSASVSIEYPVDIKQGETINLFLSAPGVLRTDERCPCYYNDTSHLISNGFHDGASINFTAPTDITKIILYVRADAFIAAGATTLTIGNNSGISGRLNSVELQVGTINGTLVTINSNIDSAVRRISSLEILQSESDNKIRSLDKEVNGNISITKNVPSASVSIEYPVDIKQGETVDISMLADGVLSDSQYFPIYYNDTNDSHKITPSFKNRSKISFEAPVNVNKIIVYITAVSFVAAGNATLSVAFQNSLLKSVKKLSVEVEGGAVEETCVKTISSASVSIEYPVDIKQGETVNLSLSAPGVLRTDETCPAYYNDTSHLISNNFHDGASINFTAPTDITKIILYVRADAFIAAGDSVLTVGHNVSNGLISDVDNLIKIVGLYNIESAIARASISVEYPVDIKQGETVNLSLSASGILRTDERCPGYYNDTSHLISNGFHDGASINFTAPTDVTKIILYIRADAFIAAGNSVLTVKSGILQNIDNLNREIGTSEKITKPVPSASVSIEYPVDIKQGETVKLKLNAPGVIRADDWCPVYYNDTEHLITNGFYEGAIIDFTAPTDITKIILYVRADAFIAAGSSTLEIFLENTIYYILLDSLKKSEVILNTFGYCYNEKNINSALSQFAAYFDNRSQSVEPFLFFTDPHLFFDTTTVTDGISDADRQEAMSLIEKAFNMSAAKYVLCGGDWLTSHKGTKAYTCLSWIDGIMNALFQDKYYLINGNHDNNYQAKTHYGDEGLEAIPNNVMVNLLYKRFGNNKMYYSFFGLNTRWFILDTGIDWVDEMTEYRWEQIDWLATQLLSCTDAHIAIGMHIISNSGDASNWQEHLASMTTIVTQLLSAYNSKTSITLNGQTYDFSSVNGTVHFILAGHAHFDTDGVVNGIPIIVTTNVKPNYMGHNITFDLAFADYDEHKLYMTRIGAGSDREIQIV